MQDMHIHIHLPFTVLGSLDCVTGMAGGVGMAWRAVALAPCGAALRLAALTNLGSLTSS